MSCFTTLTLAGIVVLAFIAGATVGILLCAMMTVAKGESHES